MRRTSTAAHTRFARSMRALITIISLPLKGRLGNKNNNNCGGGLGGSHAYGLTAIEDLMWLELDHRDLWAVSGRDLTQRSYFHENLMRSLQTRAENKVDLGLKNAKSGRCQHVF